MPGMLKGPASKNAILSASSISPGPPPNVLEPYSTQNSTSPHLNSQGTQCWALESRPRRNYQLVVSPGIVGRVAAVAGKGVVTPQVTAHAVAADPDDNRILECAIAGKADIIVSNDHHLLDLKSTRASPSWQARIFTGRSG